MLYYNVAKYILTKNFTNKFTERSLTGMTFSAKMPLTYLLTYVASCLHADRGKFSDPFVRNQIWKITNHLSVG